MIDFVGSLLAVLQILGVGGVGLVAFASDTVAAISFRKALSIIACWKVNPRIETCGISAFPLFARVIAEWTSRPTTTSSLAFTR